MSQSVNGNENIWASIDKLVKFLLMFYCLFPLVSDSTLISKYIDCQLKKMSFCRII